MQWRKKLQLASKPWVNKPLQVNTELQLPCHPSSMCRVGAGLCDVMWWRAVYCSSVDQGEGNSGRQDPRMYDCLDFTFSIVDQNDLKNVIHKYAYMIPEIFLFDPHHGSAISFCVSRVRWRSVLSWNLIWDFDLSKFDCIQIIVWVTLQVCLPLLYLYYDNTIVSMCIIFMWHYQVELKASGSCWAVRRTSFYSLI